jgi:hypothetical protein
VSARSGATPSAPKPKRWGLRTIGFVILATVALFTALAQGYNSWGTFGCTVVGFVGAGYCTYRGLKQLLGGTSRHVR